MTVYRVFPFDPSAAPSEKGGALYVPPTNAGRIANADLCSELYVAGSAEAAIGETFGRIPIWHASDFFHADGKPFAIASYTLAAQARIFNLNDIDALRKLKIAKPTDVVTRDRKKTWAWAREIFRIHEFDGASWWSYYRPEWVIFGIWAVEKLFFTPPARVLTPDDPAVRAAADVIVRQVV